MLLFEVFAVVYRYGFRYVMLFVGNGIYVFLVLKYIKEVREVFFFEFREIEGFGKGGKRYLKEGEGVNEAYFVESYLY